jgi:hypothetical protein
MFMWLNLFEILSESLARRPRKGSFKAIFKVIGHEQLEATGETHPFM